MITFILNLVISGVAVAIAAYIAPGVEVSGLWVAILVSVVFGLVNAIIGSILRTLTFPLNFITFGLVSFIITILMVFLTEKFVSGFETWWWISAAIFAILLWCINGILWVDKEKK